MPRVANTEKDVAPEVFRGTPFEHEVTAEPEELRVVSVLYTKPDGAWSTKTGTPVHTPALPTWMTATSSR
jgi:hypothetical protein